MNLLYTLFKIGYDEDGYDKHGYNRDGYNRQGFNIEGYDKNGYNKFGYDKDGFNRQGFNAKGIDKDGYDTEGYHMITGYDRNGFDRQGFDMNGYNAAGYDRSGYNIDGYDKDGFDRNGFNAKGIDKDGYDIEGYHVLTGYNRDGFNRKGYNAAGYDRSGYNVDGYDKDGFDRNGFNAKGIDKDGYDIEGYHVETGYNRNGFNRKGFNKFGFDRFGYDEEGYDCNGFDKYGYNKSGYDHDGFDKYGFDKSGFNKKGFDKDGNNRHNLVVGQELYHSIFGKGIFRGFESDGCYISVDFQTEGIKLFQYPNGIGEFLFIEKPHKIKQRDKFLSNEENRKEDEFERAHFDKICAIIDVPLKRAQNEYDLSKYAFNDFSDSYNPRAFSDWQHSNVSLEYYQNLRREPFFARIDYKNKTGLYIGKHEIKDEVVDWADPICNLYYEYQIYIGNQEYDLSLVRNFDIITGRYYGFTDAYSKHIIKDTSESESGNIITDPMLLMIINANKEEKKVHDIISTIQANQYKIITSDPSTNLLVLGCAGSGKTMILFHRLRYILRNNKSFDIKNVYLISPTGLLNSESNDLTSTLQIQNANRLSTVQFHKRIIELYYKKYEIFEDLSDKNIMPNVHLSASFIKTQYSQQNISKLISVLHSILNDENEKVRFIEKEKDRLVKMVSAFTKTHYNNLSEVTSQKDPYYSFLELYDNSVSDLKSISKENIIAMISHMKKMNTNKKYRITVLELLLSLNLFWGSTKRTKKGDIYINEDCLKSVFKLFEQTNWNGGKKGSKDYILGHYNPIDFYREYSKIIDQLNRLYDFENNIKYAYLFDLIKSIIDNEKKANGISLSHLYEYELFIHLCMCHDTFGALSTNQYMTFIDEFQDFSNTELMIYKKIFPNGIFNFYGDFNQCINAKGTHSIESLECVDSTWGNFEISENYRNAYDITQYVNNKFNMNMMPIGIKGNVFTEKFSIDAFKLSIEDDRIACIVKDNNPITIEFAKHEKFNIITDSDNSIIRGKINVVPVSLVKGLEFERVYVIPEGMSRNEEYVAYTRALNELYIIE